VKKAAKPSKGKQVGWRISEDLRDRVNVRAIKDKKSAEDLVAGWLEEKLNEADARDAKRGAR